MKKYLSFFRVRFHVGLQYRTATIGAVVTQLPWGLMECLAFRTFQEADPLAFPMEFSAVVAYMWLKEAFFLLFTVWGNVDQELFDMILKGDIAYELCRPVSLYKMWFARVSAARIANAALRCVPILAVALLLPQPFRLMMPGSFKTVLFFLLAMVLAVGVTVSFCMLVYITAFFTISPNGLRLFCMSAVEFLSGSILPIPFMPKPVQTIVELLPFAGMMNVPFRIYSGDLAGRAMMTALFMQVFWFAVLLAAGVWLCRLAEKKLVVQGG
ncbi:MAG: ABC transporter permease [Eubacterium sp.]|nr:ABC transporter permease [Eubacterium sp.]